MGGDDGWMDGHSRRACRENILRDYRLRKKSLNVLMSEDELPAVALRAVVVSFCTARSRSRGVDEDGRANIRDARSSYAACVSRGFWPKRPKAQGAAVDVGNREKDAGMLGEDILAVVCVRTVCSFLRFSSRS